MRTIKALPSLIQQFGQTDRSGQLSIQQQTFFVRPTPMHSQMDASDNMSDFNQQMVDGWNNLSSFTDMIDVLEKVYGDNVASTVPTVPMPELVGPYNKFLEQTQLPLPRIDTFQMEIRDAQPFSQNLYHFIEQEPEQIQKDLMNKVRTTLAEFNLPGEMININFYVMGSCSTAEVYRSMTFMTALLKEAAKEIQFLPGRAVGTYSYITE